MKVRLWSFGASVAVVAVLASQSASGSGSGSGGSGSFPGEPSANPTAQPAEPPVPSDAVNFFPYTTAALSNTSSATQNTVLVVQDVCPGDRLTFSTCAQYSGDTYIRLYLEGEQVAENDDSDSDGDALCSSIDYTYRGDSCYILVLQLGCYGTGECQMTATSQL
ncbi:hypothetical protein B484DRAFT_403116 [Ochromonadaceae sp. CCMP2298]|nr:hypothetical protein B484DRAFT_403116 [Ochromonadaceae sp. CCMP2298]